ncbi:Uncharacterised protein [Chlamydia trachomatis]|nr:Uncharacterised protein [Chlamydia trachomatis]
MTIYLERVFLKNKLYNYFSLMLRINKLYGALLILFVPIVLVTQFSTRRPFIYTLQTSVSLTVRFVLSMPNQGTLQDGSLLQINSYNL